MARSTLSDSWDYKVVTPFLSVNLVIPLSCIIYVLTYLVEKKREKMLRKCFLYLSTIFLSVEKTVFDDYSIVVVLGQELL